MDIVTNEKAIIITGGPGMGKTAIIDRLREYGYPCVVESGRDIIRSELERGGDKLPWADRRGYAEAMFVRAMADYDSARGRDAYTFFDRGIPDVIGYLKLCALPIPDGMWREAERCRYHDQVFATPPWEEIYRNDGERKQDFNEAKATYEQLVQVYGTLGYRVTIMPKLPIDERCRFILEALEVSGTTFESTK